MRFNLIVSQEQNTPSYTGGVNADRSIQSPAHLLLDHCANDKEQQYT